MTGLHLFNKHLLNANCGLVLGYGYRLIRKWSLPFGNNCFIGDFRCKKEGGKVSEGVTFELNQSLKVNWSTELEEKRERGLGRWTFQKKQITWSKAWAQKKPEALKNCKTFCVAESREHEAPLEEHSWRGNEGPELVPHIGPLMPLKRISFSF